MARFDVETGKRKEHILSRFLGCAKGTADAPISRPAGNRKKRRAVQTPPYVAAVSGSARSLAGMKLRPHLARQSARLHFYDLDWKEIIKGLEVLHESCKMNGVRFCNQTGGMQ